MANKKKGLKIGKYRITPLGLGVIGVLLLVVIALVVLLVIDPFGSALDVQKAPNAKATAAPTVEAEETVEPEVTPIPTPTAKPEPRSATIRSLGEIAIETDLLKSAFDAETSTFDFSPMFSEIKDIIGDADYTVADVEGTLGDTVSISGTGSKMNTPSALLTALKECGVDMLTLANDHILDGTFAELTATMENITNAGLSYIGAAATQEERNTPVIKDVNGIKVGFVAYTESIINTSNVDPRAQEYAVYHVANSNAFEDIARTRAAGADVIVAYVSWGQMLNRVPTKSQQQIAMVLNQAGVDVIIGYHPHVVQGAYWLEGKQSDGTVKRTLCLCATGNLLSNQRSQYADSGVIFEFTIQEQEDGTFTIENPLYIPTYVWRYQNEESGLYQYRVLAAGQWTDDRADERPEGMSYADLQRMGAVWTEVQQVINPEIATITRE